MSARSALMLPREHGAWAMLAVSYLLGVLVGARFDAAIAALGASALFVFISRESLLSWRRAQRRGRDAQRAGRLFVAYIALAVAAGLPLLWTDYFWNLAPLAAAAAALLVFNGEQGAQLEDRTIGNELLAIAGITLLAPAVYCAARGGWQWEAFVLWMISAAYFASSVFYVKLRVLDAHARKADARNRVRRFCFGYHASLLAALVLLAVTERLSVFAVVAFAPVLWRAFLAIARPVRELNLRRIGMLEIAYSAVFLAAVAIAFRAG